MTMPRSIRFSGATAAAIAISSALLALTAAGAAVAMKLFLYGFDVFGAVGAERRGGVDELVGQEQLGRRNVGERQAVLHAGLVGEPHVLAVQPPDRAGKLLAAAARLGNADAGFVAGPVGIIAEGGRGTGDPRRADLEPEAALDRVVGVEPFGQTARDGLAVRQVEL